jgi:hypothetical protein
MANKRVLSWSAAMRDLDKERRARADVREERLRSAQGLAGTPALALSAWRGRSGRRYVVGVHGLARGAADDDDVVSMGEAVVIAVRRDGAGLAEVVDVTAAGESPRERLAPWLHRVRARGATEMHVHRLAVGEGERRAIVADLEADAEVPEPRALN